VQARGHNPVLYTDPVHLDAKALQLAAAVGGSDGGVADTERLSKRGKVDDRR
jgi:hypothetical protein